jgi:PadR family transcriptional regulator, regulatory protein PadR
MVNVRREMMTGLVSVRILHAASRRPVSGVELAEDLECVGHRISPGTLYPLLHHMQKSGWLKCDGKTVKGKRRKYYRATKKGRGQLEDALAKLERFLAGIIEFEPSEIMDGRAEREESMHGRGTPVLDGHATHNGIAGLVARSSGL